MHDTKPTEQDKRYVPYKKFIGSLVPNWIMKRSDLTQGAKLCFGRLAQFAGKSEYAFPGHDALAKELGVSVSAVKGYLSELTEARLIESERMGSRNCNRYYFLVRPGVVEFKTDGHSAIYHSQSSDGHGTPQLMDTKRPTDGYKTAPAIIVLEENQEENQKRIKRESGRESERETTALQALQDALNHIEAVGGAELAEAMQTKGRKRSEVLERVAKSDAQILTARGLLIHGWPLYRVKKHRPSVA